MFFYSERSHGSTAMKFIQECYGHYCKTIAKTNAISAHLF